MILLIYLHVSYAFGVANLKDEGWGKSGIGPRFLDGA
jgi:hypothetical protein